MQKEADLPRLDSDVNTLKSDMRGVKADITSIKATQSGHGELLKDHSQRLDRIEVTQGEHTKRFDRLETVMLQILDRLPQSE